MRSFRRKNEELMAEFCMNSEKKVYNIFGVIVSTLGKQLFAGDYEDSGH